MAAPAPISAESDLYLEERDADRMAIMPIQDVSKTSKHG